MLKHLGEYLGDTERFVGILAGVIMVFALVTTVRLIRVEARLDAIEESTTPSAVVQAK